LPEDEPFNYNYRQIMIMNYLINGPVTRDIISLFVENMGMMMDSGGHSVFIGQVRADEIDGKKVKAIDYSAYEGMVKTEADKIKETILAEFEDTRSVEIVHSTGKVMAGGISLFVLVSAGHRKQAIEACSKAVELIKENLPVWKKEIFDDDSHEWKQNQ
jgi:molybdopterin synthase catalytic subunit